jgi:hypothetical protein
MCNNNYNSNDKLGNNIYYYKLSNDYNYGLFNDNNYNEENKLIVVKINKYFKNLII